MRSAARANLLILCVLVVPTIFTATIFGQTIIVDNADAGFSILSGSWGSGAYGTPYGVDYRYATTSTTATAEVEWRPVLPFPGEYEVAVRYVSGANRATDAPFSVHHAGGSATTLINQQLNSSTWIPLGVFDFMAGNAGYVTLNNQAGPTVVIADAVRFRSAADLVRFDDPLIRVGGALFAEAGDFALRLDRIDPNLFATAGDLFSPSVAVLTSGVTLHFRTDSPTIQAHFNHLSYVVTENTGYVVYQDGVFDQLVNDLETVSITSHQPGSPVTLEIVCPSYDEVTLSELQLEPGATLYPLPPDRRVRYFAIGDSITHGAEIDADTKGDSTTSYPWQLAAAKGWELYNLAVGGSKVTPDFGHLLAGQQADIITIMWGVNDKGHDNDLDLFIMKYHALLDNLRAAQPKTPIYCIRLIASSSNSAGSNGYTLDDYRDAIVDIVATRQALGDCNLHLIDGESLTSLADLSDGVHLSVTGAANFAAALNNVIPNPWGDFNADGRLDGSDWLSLPACLSGADIIAPAGTCEDFDHDCDQDVDLRELAAFQARLDP